MKNSGLKKFLSLLLSIIMIFTMLPVSVFVSDAASYPTMKSFNAASGDDFHKYYRQVYTVTFLDEIDTAAMNDAIEKWDISAQEGSGEVMAWMYLNQYATELAGQELYDVYIAGEGGVSAHEDTTHMFYVFSSLKEVRGMEHFHTGKVNSFLYWFGNCNELESIDLSKLDTSSATTLRYCFYGCYKLREVDASSWNVSNVTSLERMFYRCYALQSANLSGWDTRNVTNMYGVFEMTPPTGVSPDYSLKSVDLTGWDTSNVTTMENMFKNCEALEELDLSNFDTSKVTSMRFMFYYCKHLKNIYVGDGWTTQAIKNINDGVFNCCYALIGGKDNQAENEQIYNEKHPSAYYPPSVEYAKFKEDGGYLTDASQKPTENEYTVTYNFIGDIIPENVTAPESKIYKEGSTVSIEDDASAEHYIFSGWSTDDAAVDADGNFIINNDVEFVGSWTKLYKVEYKYTEGFEVPEGAPEIPDTQLWFAPGEDVPVYGLPYVPEYVFVGWATEDAEVIGDEFTMPENDVVLYGFFKKPVESVEIINNEDIIINEDGEAKINVYVKPEDATIKDIVYESSDESVVTVDKYGNIEAVGEGTATVTVYAKDDPTKSDTITVTVKIPVTEITVDKTEINLNKGDKDKINADVNDGATNKKVIYESSNETVVKVDENGNIEAVGEGKATVTVKSEDDPSVKEEIKVTVKIPVTEITVTEDFNLEINEAKNLEAEVNEDATNKDLIYESSDPGVVKVDNDGNVIAVGEGTAIITVISKDNPEITETVTVTVIRKYKVTYAFIGSVIPENVTAPEEAEYISGTEVAVEDNAAADGYVFSGWSTEDNADIKDDKFIISNDVHFVGSWSKLYNVTYEYEGEVPADAPDLPDKEAYLAGKAVNVEDTPEVEGYTFTGWTTADAQVSDGMFTMPEKDVVLKGKFEKIIIDVEDVEAEKTAFELEPGQTDEIKVTVTPDDATNKEVTYESSDESVVKVDENGKITAVGEGTATITVTSKDDETKKEIITVTVKTPEPEKVPVEDVEAEKTEYELEPGQSDEIKVTVTPDDATDKEITFESSDESVVKVDENGKITAVGEGTATITVTSKDDETKKEIITVTVKTPEPEKVPVEDVEAEKTEYELEPGETDEIKVTVTPDDATNKEVTYESSDESVVKVDENGKITAVGEGTATITVTSKDDPTKTETVTVTVKTPEPEKVPVEDVEAEKTEYELEPGQTDEIKVTVTPDDATNKEVTYESSDESVVKVDENGKITAVGEGTATITVTSKDDPAKTETVTVTVKTSAPSEPEVPEEPEYIIEVPERIDLIIGQNKNIGVIITPDDGKIKPIYTSSDESVIKIDADGNITAVGIGSATITVDFGNGDIRVIPVTVAAIPLPPRKHHICFGKTDGIGWYEVSVNGGDFFPQGPNSTLEVYEGSVLVIRVQDMWIDDEFDFYVNGKRVEVDAANTITVVVDGYMLIGALSMDMQVPDVEESLTLLQKIIQAIKDFFNWIAELFK